MTHCSQSLKPFFFFLRNLFDTGEGKADALMVWEHAKGVSFDGSNPLI